jgi:hypothetical protein
MRHYIIAASRLSANLPRVLTIYRGPLKSVAERQLAGERVRSVISGWVDSIRLASLGL